ncbi:ATP-grasp domain-containing protein [Candidatus Saccharibacteria bacterium]|nr:ATP-grasp domain-containing protein [Candidatus Saccharibacteria bacterium]
MRKKQILVLFSYRNHKLGYIEMLFSRLSEAAKERDLELFRGSLKDMHIEIIDGQLRITEALTGRDIKSFDLVYFNLWYKCPQQALAVAKYCDYNNIPYFSKELANIVPLTKVGELAMLANSNVPLPRTFTSSRREIIRSYKKRSAAPIPYPVVVKAADGYGGNNNFLIHNFAELQNVLNGHKDLTFIIQEFIPNDCDYRCIVLGGKIRFILKRTRDTKSDTHINNTSAGAEGVAVPLNSISDAAKQAVLAAAYATSRESFAGVDLMINKVDNEPVILEVNQTPQIQDGAATDQKMSILLDYIEEIAK